MTTTVDSGVEGAVDSFFTANPNASTADVASAVTAAGGMTPQIAAALAKHYGTTADVVQNAYTSLTSGNATTGSTGDTTASSGNVTTSGNVDSGSTSSSPLSTSLTTNTGSSNVGSTSNDVTSNGVASNGMMSTTSTPTSTIGSAYFAANPDVAAAYAQDSKGMTPDQYAQMSYNMYGAGQGLNSPQSDLNAAQGVKQISGTDITSTRGTEDNPQLANIINTLSATPQLTVSDAGHGQVNYSIDLSDPSSQMLARLYGGTTNVPVTEVSPGVFQVTANADGGGGLAYYFTADPTTGKITSLPTPNASTVQYVQGQGGGFSGGVLPFIASVLPATAPFMSAYNIANNLANGQPVTGATVLGAVNAASGILNSPLTSSAASTLGVDLPTGTSTSQLISNVTGIDQSTVNAALQTAKTTSQVASIVNALQTGNTAELVNSITGLAKTGLGSSNTGTSGTTSTDSTSNVGSSNVATVNAGTNNAGTEVIDPNSVTNAATVASSANSGQNSEAVSQNTNSFVDINNAPIDTSKLTVNQPVVSTDPNTGIKTSITLEDNKDVTQVVTDPVLQTQEVTTTSPDGSKVVETNDKVTGLYTVDTYDAEGNLVSSNSSPSDDNSDVQLNPVTVTGGSDTYVGDLSPLASVNTPTSHVENVDLTNTGNTETGNTSNGTNTTNTTNTTSSTSPLINTPNINLNKPTSSGGSSSSTTQTTSTPSSSGFPSSPSFLPMVATMLAGAPVYGKAQGLAQLRQIYDNLDPNLAKVLQQSGILPPEPPKEVAKSEEPTQAELDQANAQLKAEQPETAENFLFAAEGGSTFSDLVKNTEYKNIAPVAPTMLGAAPVTQQESRISPLHYLKQGIRRDSPSTSMLAHGGLPHKYRQAAPEGHNPEFITGLTGYYASGKGTGQSDDIPAMLHDGDYVMDADTVASLGDGSSKAGAEILTKFHHEIPHKMSVGGNPVPAKIADGEYVFPASFVTALGGGDNKLGSKLLDTMREELRAHKRSAPDTKIPPKAKSPLEYLKMAKG